jgi:hypothetical protein
MGRVKILHRDFIHKPGQEQQQGEIQPLFAKTSDGIC